MGPKIESAIAYLDRGGTEAIVTDPANLGAAVRRQAGTRILPGR
jgi:carbamate kinase